jgi:2-amino-4-hydroxy-6-hydroxymethyldihydropteridine diphosphokinase
MSREDGGAGSARDRRSLGRGIRERVRGFVPAQPQEFAFLGLGSNVGDRLAHLQGAVNRLDADPRSHVDAVSSVYQAEPVGGPPGQEPYLNMAVRLATQRSPLSILRLCQTVEEEHGRTRAVRWGPRTLDIDVLLYGHRLIASGRLVVPHPRLVWRPFALIPLIEVAPGMTLPDGTSLTTVLVGLAPVEGVTMVGGQVRQPQDGSGGASS